MTRVTLESLIDHRRTEWQAVDTGRPDNVDPSWWTVAEAHHSGAGGRGVSLTQVKALERAMIAGGKYVDIWYHLVILENGSIVEGRGVRKKNSTRPHLTVLFMGNYVEVGANAAQLAAFAKIAAAVGGQLTWHDERAQQFGTSRTACCGAALIRQLEHLRTTVMVTPEPQTVTPPPLPAGVYPADSPVVTVLAADTGPGYAIVCADGGVFCFGGFPFSGSAAPHLSPGDRIVTACKTGGGYLLVAESGAVFAFGAARYSGRVQVADV